MSGRAIDSAAKPAAEASTAATVSHGLTRARSLSLHRKCACGGDAGHGTSCESCASQQTTLQRRSDGGGAGSIPASVDHTLAQAGRPLDDDARSFMETRFGEDFSGVRVHDDSTAAQSARDVHAHAYTVGQDIVFAPGQYQPNTDHGRHLIAHELAHTVQQRGLQRSGVSSLADQGPEYRRLEREADRAAEFAMRGGIGSSNYHLQAATRPHLSRVPDAGTALPATGTGATVPITVTSVLTTTHRVTPIGGHSRGGATQAFDVDKLYVPATKGPRAMEFYSAAATGGSLNATLRTSSIRSEQWQRRDDTDGLRARWMNIVGWTPTTANQRWSDAGGEATFPNMGGEACQMDHIIELQISGNNANENIQALDRAQNVNSGGAIKNQVFGLARQILENEALISGSVNEIQLQFHAAEMVPSGGRSTPEVAPTGVRAANPTCLSVEICARNAARIATAAASEAGTAPEMFPLSAGGTPASIRVPTGFTTGSGAATVPILADTANRAASELISGLLLVDLQRSDRGRRFVNAKLDTRDRTRVPLTLEDDTASIMLTVGATAAANGYPLTLAPGSRRQNLRFTYPYLSPGTITSIERRPDGTLNWSGEIRPTVPLLPNPMTVNYRDGAFTVGVPLNRRSLSNAIPGFTVTEAEVALQLAPTLSATGHIAFSLGRGPRPIATGTVDVGADTSGITATGQIRVNVPGIDEVSGTITMRNGVWSGQIVIESTQIRIPNVQRGRLQLDIDSSGVRPSGEVQLLLPRNLGTATLGVTREAGHFVFSGNGRLRVPGLDNEVDVTARYTNGSFTATARGISFTWRSFTGTLEATYTQAGEAPGRISGTGTVRIARGNLRGNVTVTLHDSGRISGRGTVSYPLTVRGTRIDASATIILNETGGVRVEGAITLPQPIELFRVFRSERTLFSFNRSIPIPGLSIGLVGVVAVVEGSISAGYSFGPGQLRNVRITAGFDPLAENINPELTFHCELNIPASASLTAMIGGGVGVEAGVGRVSGTLRITANLGLTGGLVSTMDVIYRDSAFSVSARPGIEGALRLGLSLDANARAEAGFGPFTIGVEKTWNLGRRNVTLGQFSVYAPLSYSSTSGIQIPSMDQLEWGPIETPDPARIVNELFNGATATERETPT